jgi:hypothetical protein
MTKADIEEVIAASAGEISASDFVRIADAVWEYIEEYKSQSKSESKS